MTGNMSVRWMPGLAAILCAVSAAAGPANPNTNARTAAVLEYLTRLPEQAEGRMLAGQFSECGSQASVGPCEEVFKVTGHWPALIGLDYSDQGATALETHTPNHAAIAYAKEGGLVTISAHLYNPTNPAGGGLRDTGVDMRRLLTPGDDGHDRWMAMLDTLAAGLAELQDANVPVLWRPFHEMNGGWFWWGAQEPDVFIAVWRHMFDYFTNTKGLNNLLWVYGPNHGKKTADYYPGDNYVDIVGLDAYTDRVDPKHIVGGTEIMALPKPFALTEFGPHGSSNPPGDYDYLRFLQGVQEHFPKAVFFQSWGNKWGLMQNQNTKELMADPWIIGRERLPKFP